MAELVHLRLDQKTRKAIRTVVQERHFQSESDFIRDAIRRNLEMYERMAVLSALRGSASRRKTKPAPTSDVFREFGINVR